jgi:hypothetical protein
MGDAGASCCHADAFIPAESLKSAKRYPSDD